MKPRDYQQKAVDAAITWMKRSVEPAVLDLATGAGKSFIIALIADWLSENTGKKTLVIAPSKELVEQDYEKYLHTGNPASIFCASIKKCLRHNVIFGTPQTVSNSIRKFGSGFACVIIDEGDGITPTLKKVIEHLRKKNSKLRVLGLTGTPYRLSTGYIYQYDQDDRPMPEQSCIEPYYFKLLYRLSASELIEQGYLTPPHADLEHMQGYDTSNLELNRLGKFDAKQIEQTFEGKGRLTSMIVADIVQKSYNRNGVLIFASTVQHAHEVLESLPQGNSDIICGSTGKIERELIIDRFKRRQIKYLVNVKVLTVGFDAPHVDVVAILAATESVRLMQQIIGRGLRLVDPALAGNVDAIAKSEKPDCLVLDYAGNIERHCPDGDLFNPVITATKSTGEKVPINAKCPACNFINEFTARPNDDNLEINEFGYFEDLAGEQLDMPAHYGRRCYGYTLSNGTYDRCEYRWSIKECHECEHENDIAARYCEKCKAELVDPNEKLSIEFSKLKRDPYSATSDKVLSWYPQVWVSQAGNTTLRIDWTTDYRTFTIWYPQYQDTKNPKARQSWIDLCRACDVRVGNASDFCKSNPAMPTTITASKDRNSGFYRVHGYNREEDVLNEVS